MENRKELVTMGIHVLSILVAFIFKEKFFSYTEMSSIVDTDRDDTADRDDADSDVISSLPDDVICHILSFLLTKQVVATSTLSKRWTHLWRYVPVINFRGKYLIELGDIETLIRFNDAVYSVLLFRGSDSIKSFSVKIQFRDHHLEDLGFPKVLKWINHVVQHNVEFIDIRVDIDYAYFPKLPASILSCKTLVVLKLRHFTMEDFSFVRFPSLKILRLKYFTLLDVRDLVLFLSGCPNLEDLYTYHSYIPVGGNSWKDSLAYQDYESLRLNKLTRAQMPYTFWHFPVKALHNVEELYIEINKVYRNLDEIPTFHNLTKLKLHSINSNWDLLFQMLNHCPKLQDVELSQGSVMGYGREDNVQQKWVDPKFVPQCLSLHLKTCTIWDFKGKQNERQLAIYILNNARVLQTMKLCSYAPLEKEKELSLCSKASPTCELIYQVWKIFDKEKKKTVPF